MWPYREAYLDALSECPPPLEEGERMLSRPVDTDASQTKLPPIEPGYYKMQVKSMVEWGSNKDLNIKGEMSKLDEVDADNVSVISLRWELQIVEDSRYDGTGGSRPFTRNMFTTYWASPEKLEESRQNSIIKYLEKNPDATPEDAEQNAFIWKPQMNTYEFLYACKLMEKHEEDTLVEYTPLGWEMTREGFDQAITAAMNCVVYAKIGKNDFGPDQVLGVSQVKEK